MLTISLYSTIPIHYAEFDYEHLLAQPSSLFQAGFEAGSTTIALALYHLACHPEHQATLFDEIQTHLTGKEWTIDQLNEMSFTESILIETLRLFAPLPFTDRVAERDYEVRRITESVDFRND